MGAELLRRVNALRQSDAILEDARRRSAQLEAEMQSRLSDLRWEFEKLSIEKQRFTDGFRSLLEDYLEHLTADQRARTERPGKNGGPRTKSEEEPIDEAKGVPAAAQAAEPEIPPSVETPTTMAADE